MTTNSVVGAPNRLTCRGWSYVAHHKMLFFVDNHAARTTVYGTMNIQRMYHDTEMIQPVQVKGLTFSSLKIAQKPRTCHAQPVVNGGLSVRALYEPSSPRGVAKVSRVDAVWADAPSPARWFPALEMPPERRHTRQKCTALRVGARLWVRMAGHLSPQRSWRLSWSYSRCLS